jgi:signal transduction histidine kinase
VKAPQPTPQVNADAVRLEQIIVNLLTNAIKYTPAHGQIEVSIERECEQAVLRVRDSGMGIAAEMLPRVFDLFTQAEATIDRAKGGMGIGLTLVRSLAELHGGGVEAHRCACPPWHAPPMRRRATQRRPRSRQPGARATC